MPFNRIDSRLIEGVRTRRLLVALFYFGLAIVILTGVLHAFNSAVMHTTPYLVFVLVALGALSGGYSGLILIPWVLAIETKRRNLDERLGRRRKESYAAAYRIFTVVFCCEAMVWILRDMFASDPAVFRNAEVISQVVLLDFMLLSSLPMAIFAWTEPDPIHDELEPRAH